MSATKYKVGDKVKIREGSGHILEGKTTVITRINDPECYGQYGVDELGALEKPMGLREDEIEGYAFKVGDRVELVDVGDYAPTFAFRVGCVGTIENICFSEIQVRWDDFLSLTHRASDLAPVREEKEDDPYVIDWEIKPVHVEEDELFKKCTAKMTFKEPIEKGNEMEEMDKMEDCGKEHVDIDELEKPKTGMERDALKSAKELVIGNAITVKERKYAVAMVGYLDIMSNITFHEEKLAELKNEAKKHENKLGITAEDKKKLF